MGIARGERASPWRYGRCLPRHRLCLCCRSGIESVVEWVRSPSYDLMGVDSSEVMRFLRLFCCCLFMTVAHDVPAEVRPPKQKVEASPRDAAPKVMAEAQVVALFFERNLELIASLYQIDEAEAQEWIASAIPNPFLSFGFNELGGYGGSFSANPQVGQKALGYNLIVTQLIETNGKRALRTESSQIGREAVETDFKDTVRILLNRVRRAVYDVLLAQKALSVAHDVAHRYDKIVHANQLRHSVGDIAESDLVRVEVESLKAKGEVDKAMAFLKSNRSALANLLNWPQEAMIVDIVDEWPSVPDYLEKSKDTVLVEEAYATRPDLKAQSLRADQMEREVELARRLIVPDVTVSAGFVHDGGNLVTDSGIFNISAPMPIFNQFQGDIGKAVAGLNQARLQKEQVRNTIHQEVISAHASLMGAAAVVARFEHEVNQRIEKVRDSAEFAYGQGAIGLIDLLDAERNYKAMTLDYFSALRDKALAYADLLAAIGEETRH